ncbi:unnamed protein product [Larinioides sclopetarius]|uniref:Uncharacterized protein n=1 Tax=Larinioides sclopetarius TaxID=280406 RepID=A0AAV2A011_9ARAC
MRETFANNLLSPSYFTTVLNRRIFGHRRIQRSQGPYSTLIFRSCVVSTHLFDLCYEGII